MTVPAERCLRALEFLAPTTDSLVAIRVLDELDKMERAYASSEERIDALAWVLSKMSHQAWSQGRTPFKRFVAAVIEQRLSEIRSS